MKPSPWRRALLLNLVFFMVLSPAAAVQFQHSHQLEPPTPPVWPLPEDETEARKARMINLLLPLIQEHNLQLVEKRERLGELKQRLEQGKRLRLRDRTWLANLRDQYKVPEEMEQAPAMALLLRRVDLIPADMALAQAAMESAWGTSRFSRNANNYFGQWCFRKGCGMVPKQRPKGANYEVAHFASITDSVGAYMLNLNSHPSYQGLRKQREQLRRQGEMPDGYSLAAGLKSYSSLGSQYIMSIRGLIRSNGLSRFPSLP